MLDLMLWRARWTEWMQLRRWSERTVGVYLWELGPLFRFLESKGVESIGELNRSLIEAYRLHLFYMRRPDGRPLSHSRQQVRLAAVKAFCRFLRQERYLLLDPAVDVASPRANRVLPRVPTEREVLRLLSAPDVKTPLGLRDRAILELLYSTGIRNTELRSLSLEELERDRRQLIVRRGKGRKQRVVPLGEEAAYWVDEYLTRGRPQLARDPRERHVFLTWRGQPLATTEALSELVRRAVRQARLKHRITPHSLRHAMATHMLRGGAGLRHLQEMLGHASAGTTQRYTRVELTDLRRVHRRCHPRERGRAPADE